jgi:hypothetical protein
MSGRIPQAAAAKGSQRWLQTVVNCTPELLNAPLRQYLTLLRGQDIQWLSPLANDDYAEYRDGEFLERLGVQLLRKSLESFWPKRGPVWDGLARSSRGDLLLVEAKAHLSEIASPPSKAGQTSLSFIRKSLSETRDHLGATSGYDWAGTYYQYTNRLAHLYLLRQLNAIRAWLVFVYFVNARDVSGPARKADWENEILKVQDHLGIQRGSLSAHVIDLFIDVGDILRLRPEM